MAEPESYRPPGSTTQAPLSPEEEERRRAALAASGDPGRQGQAADLSNSTPRQIVKTTGPSSGANWDVSDKTRDEIKTDQDTIDQIESNRKWREGRPGNVPTDSWLTPAEAIAAAEARFKQADAITNEQASRAGVEVGEAVTTHGGLPGLVGAKEVVKRYTAGRGEDTTTAGNKALLDQRIAEADARQVSQASAASMQASQLNQGQANQFRTGQQNLASMLGDAAAGRGPSAAQAQLQMATDQNINAQLAMAKSGTGNRAAAMKNAMMNQGQLGQQAASQSAALRAQEQQQAQGQLASVLGNAREQDLGAATTNATLSQQASTTNAGNQQQTNLANLQSGVEQQQQKDALVQTYLAQGMQLDQAKRQAEIQQAQFNADLLARQSAADKGVAMQSTAAAGQTAAATVGAVATGIAAAASDKRAKKNITDGEDETRALLKRLRPHGFEYKDDRHGEGHHIGVMAQDIEKASPDLIIDDTDGVKKIDIRKALSASLASLGLIDKRLAKIEGRRG